MTDNFNVYREYITDEFVKCPLEETDSYFAIELMRRGKDNSDMPAANVHFKNYYIRKPEDLDKYEQEIKTLCDVLRMRAYASVNVKPFRQVTLDTMAELARRVANNDFRKNYNIYESCSGSYCLSSMRRWVVDIDDCGIDSEKTMLCMDIINSPDLEPIGRDKIIKIIPSKSGIHLITTPFNVLGFHSRFQDAKYETPDIKKNHLTLLYENL